MKTSQSSPYLFPFSKSIVLIIVFALFQFVLLLLSTSIIPSKISNDFLGVSIWDVLILLGLMVYFSIRNFVIVKIPASKSKMINRILPDGIMLIFLTGMGIIFYIGYHIIHGMFDSILYDIYDLLTVTFYLVVIFVLTITLYYIITLTNRSLNRFNVFFGALVSTIAGCCYGLLIVILLGRLVYDNFDYKEWYFLYYFFFSFSISISFCRFVILENYFNRKIKPLSFIYTSLGTITSIIIMLWLATWPSTNYESIPYGDASGKAIIVEYRLYNIPNFLWDTDESFQDLLIRISDWSHKTIFNTPVKAWLFNVKDDRLTKTNYSENAFSGPGFCYGGISIINPINDSVISANVTKKDVDKCVRNTVVEYLPNGESGFEYTHKSDILQLIISRDFQRLLLSDTDNNVFVLKISDGSVDSLIHFDEEEIFLPKSFIGNKIYFYLYSKNKPKKTGNYILDISTGESKLVINDKPISDISDNSKYSIFYHDNVIHGDDGVAVKERYVNLYSMESNEIVKTMRVANISHSVMFQPSETNFISPIFNKDYTKVYFYDWNKSPVLLSKLNWNRVASNDAFTHSWISHDHYMMNVYRKVSAFLGMEINMESYDTIFFNVENKHIAYASDIIKKHRR